MAGGIIDERTFAVQLRPRRAIGDRSNQTRGYSRSVVAPRASVITLTVSSWLAEARRALLRMVRDCSVRVRHTQKCAVSGLVDLGS